MPPSDVRRRLRERAALLAWSGAATLALFGVVLSVHELEPDPAIHAFAAYAVLTGIGSIGLAFTNRRPALLGSWAWLTLLAWAAHLWAVVWLINIDALDLHDLIPATRAWPPLWPAVVIVLGVLFLVVEAVAIGALRRRLRDLDQERGASL
jgi:hypothetical protein